MPTTSVYLIDSPENKLQGLLNVIHPPLVIISYDKNPLIRELAGLVKKTINFTDGLTFDISMLDEMLRKLFGVSQFNVPGRKVFTKPQKGTCALYKEFLRSFG